MPRRNTAADYLRQLERDHPAIYADYQRGNYPSVNKPATPLASENRPHRSNSPSEGSALSS